MKRNGFYQCHVIQNDFFREKELFWAKNLSYLEYYSAIKVQSQFSMISFDLTFQSFLELLKQSTKVS